MVFSHRLHLYVFVVRFFFSLSLVGFSLDKYFCHVVFISVDWNFTFLRDHFWNTDIFISSFHSFGRLFPDLFFPCPFPFGLWLSLSPFPLNPRNFFTFLFAFPTIWLTSLVCIWRARAILRRRHHHRRLHLRRHSVERKKVERLTDKQNETRESKHTHTHSGGGSSSPN